MIVTVLGVLLLAMGATLVVTESHVPSLGMLGGPGVIAIVLGTVLAVAGLGGGLALAASAAIIIALASGGFLTIALRKGNAARRRRIHTGAEGLIGHIGVVRSWGEPAGKVAGRRRPVARAPRAAGRGGATSCTRATRSSSSASAA